MGIEEIKKSRIKAILVFDLFFINTKQTHGSNPNYIDYEKASSKGERRELTNISLKRIIQKPTCLL